MTPRLTISAAFSWHPDDSTLSCDLSDIQSMLPGHGRHKEIELQSPKTGKIFLFILQGPRYDETGEELASLWYVPLDHACPVKRWIVWND